MGRTELYKQFEEDTEVWRKRTKDLDITDAEKALTHQIIFYRDETAGWREAFYRVEEEMRKARKTNVKAPF